MLCLLLSLRVCVRLGLIGTGMLGWRSGGGEWRGGLGGGCSGGRLFGRFWEVGGEVVYLFVVMRNFRCIH